MDVVDINTVLDERGKTHGDFVAQATISQEIKDSLKTGAQYHRMTSAQREVVDMIAHKLSRLVSGNPDFDDHMVDIIGYANLYLRALKDDGMSGLGVHKWDSR